MSVVVTPIPPPKASTLGWTSPNSHQDNSKPDTHPDIVLESGSSNTKEVTEVTADWPPVIIGLLIVIAILIFVILVIVIALAVSIHMASQSQTTNNMVELTDEMQKFMPKMKTILPEMTTVMKDHGYNFTVLLHKMNKFDSFVDKLDNNPFGIVFDDFFDANLDMNRWRALAHEAADILAKLKIMDYSVKIPEQRWDAMQYCEGNVDTEFPEKEASRYQTTTKAQCEAFNTADDTAGTKGFGMCDWNPAMDRICPTTTTCFERPSTTRGKCENMQSKDHGYSSFRWIKNVAAHKEGEEILPKSLSDDVRKRMAQYEKFAKDFGGDRSNLAKLKSITAFDLPVWVSVILTYINPTLMQHVLDTTGFLEKQSFQQLICEPGAEFDHGSSCVWTDKGFKNSAEGNFNFILSIVRVMAKNAIKIW